MHNNKLYLCENHLQKFVLSTFYCNIFSTSLRCCLTDRLWSFVYWTRKRERQRFCCKQINIMKNACWRNYVRSYILSILHHRFHQNHVEQNRAIGERSSKKFPVNYSETVHTQTHNTKKKSLFLFESMNNMIDATLSICSQKVNWNNFCDMICLPSIVCDVE